MCFTQQLDIIKEVRYFSVFLRCLIVVAADLCFENCVILHDRTGYLLGKD